ncbi:MAG: sporulation protein YabP [Eubacteriales bacterium]
MKNMADMGEQIKKHDIVIRSRENVHIDGILNVISFDDQSVCLESVMGDMIIEGENLHIGTLDTEKGTVELEGTVDSLYYASSEPERKRGLFGRRGR